MIYKPTAKLVVSHAIVMVTGAVFVVVTESSLLNTSIHTMETMSCFWQHGNDLLLARNWIFWCLGSVFGDT